MLPDKLSHLFYRLVIHLIFFCLASNYEEYHGAAEDTYAARIGPLFFEANDCFVLDHADASVSLQLQTRWGRLVLGVQVCIGEEQLRQPGPFFHRFSF